MKPSSASTGQLNKDIGLGLLTYSVESPFTWFLALFFGALVTNTVSGLSASNLLIDLPRHMLQEGAIGGRVIGYTFILSVISVMLSTVDSFLVGVIYTFAYDSFSPTQKILDTKNTSLINTKSRFIIGVGRLFGAIAIATAIGLLAIFDHAIPNGGSLFVNLLLAFYSAQLSFFPLVFGILFLKTRPNAFWCALSMIVGAIAGIGLGVYSVIWDPNYSWYPILACLGTSCLIYFLGYICALTRTSPEKLPTV